MTWKELLGVEVKTQSGVKLGVVMDVVFDPGTHTIKNYEVASDGLVQRLVHQRRLLIAPSEVVEITAQAMVVIDQLATDAAIALEPQVIA